MEFTYEVKVPKDRVAVLVGSKGSVKKTIERELHIKMSIDSKEGDVVVMGDDSLVLMTAQNIVKAIGRGFNPEIALELLDEGKYLEVIDMSDYVKGSKTALVRVKSRVIGSDGKSRKTIEELTDTDTVIYGKTIAIIGNYESVRLARLAFEDLLMGSRHSTVYAMLERKRKEMRHKL